MARLVFAPHVCCGGDLIFIWRFAGSGVPRLIDTLSSEHRCKSSMISAGRRGFVRFFRSKHACLAFSQFRLSRELFVA